MICDALVPPTKYLISSRVTIYLIICTCQVQKTNTRIFVITFRKGRFYIIFTFNLTMACLDKTVALCGVWIIYILYKFLQEFTLFRVISRTIDHTNFGYLLLISQTFYFFSEQPFPGLVVRVYSHTLVYLMFTAQLVSTLVNFRRFDRTLIIFFDGLHYLK